ncbi:uncharacterized protein J3R85_007785 [Psidium guajava]|nr:uncharacterized protein J3R85_007785 [Psidium guajava]
MDSSGRVSGGMSERTRVTSCNLKSGIYFAALKMEGVLVLAPLDGFRCQLHFQSWHGRRPLIRGYFRATL